MSLASITAANPLAGFAIRRTLPLEGGLVDSAADPGGVTNFGVSLRWALAQVGLHPATVKMFDVDHDGHVDRRDIAGLTADEAADIYFADWWGPGWYGRLSPDLVAWKSFDIAVNAGPKRAALILQKSLAVAGDYVFPDAVVGAATVAAAGRQFATDGGHRLLGAMRSQQADFYSRLVGKEPSLRKFLDGWLHRAAA